MRKAFYDLADTPGAADVAGPDKHAVVIALCKRISVKNKLCEPFLKRAANAEDSCKELHVTEVSAEARSEVRVRRHGSDHLSRHLLFELLRAGPPSPLLIRTCLGITRLASLTSMTASTCRTD